MQCVTVVVLCASVARVGSTGDHRSARQGLEAALRGYDVVFAGYKAALDAYSSHKEKQKATRKTFYIDQVAINAYKAAYKGYEATLEGYRDGLQGHIVQVQGNTSTVDVFREALRGYKEALGRFKPSLVDTGKLEDEDEDEDDAPRNYHELLHGRKDRKPKGNSSLELDELAIQGVDLKELEMIHRYRSLEITGMPVKESENVYLIVRKIADQINMTRPDSVTYVQRIPSHNKYKPPNIYVMLRSKEDKYEWLNRAEEYLQLTAKQIDPSCPPMILEIHEFLTVALKKLMLKTQQVAKKLGFQKVYTADMYIFVQEKDGYPLTEIRNEEDLKIFSEGTTKIPNLFNDKLLGN